MNNHHHAEHPMQYEDADPDDQASVGDLHESRHGAGFQRRHPVTFGLGTAALAGMVAAAAPAAIQPGHSTEVTAHVIKAAGSGAVINELTTGPNNTCTAGGPANIA